MDGCAPMVAAAAACAWLFRVLSWIARYLQVLDWLFNANMERKASAFRCVGPHAVDPLLLLLWCVAVIGVSFWWLSLAFVALE